VIVLDASVLIAHFDDTDAHHERAHRILHAGVQHQLAVSQITLAQVLVAPARAGKLELVGTGLRRLKVQRVTLGEDAPERLALLRAETGLKLPDCCVLLAAEQVEARLIATFDDRLAKAAMERRFDVAG
jgi:predicted nucleic acid-binding protein